LHFLTVGKTYRQWTAAFILAVYAFIATPVQLWHHHPPAAREAGQAKAPGKGYRFMVQKNTAADDCPICSHKYSTYTDYTYTPEISSAVSYADIKLSFCSSIILSPSFHFSNKSPPVKA